MSLTLKISSLVIRTLSKPIANQIKAQAREHERFRRLCISMAQGLHRIDMRLRLGPVRAKNAEKVMTDARVELEKLTPSSPTVKTAAEVKAEEKALAKVKAASEEIAKPPYHRIRPLSETKAIESGANFISETFLFMVAGGLIFYEAWRSKRKETTRNTGVEDRLNELVQAEKAARESLLVLEKELLRLKAKHGLPKSTHHILPREIWEKESDVETKDEIEEGWFDWVKNYIPLGSQATPLSLLLSPKL
ncbi:hypothetical protein N7495_004745 [Penicillium taxi]|uniref:uncharacterized protein n=1 Tax=Penicillium taxi TaxID=168475 RepID=UPI0025455798|nr:uncharacterized protein N7495_004745 [Penicillium taxi]KAJ5900001.1 hypothetical protein N7495_004745 [Penicillium taxi]